MEKYLNNTQKIIKKYQKSFLGIFLECFNNFGWLKFGELFYDILLVFYTFFSKQTSNTFIHKKTILCELTHDD